MTLSIFILLIGIALGVLVTLGAKRIHPGEYLLLPKTQKYGRGDFERAKSLKRVLSDIVQYNKLANLVNDVLKEYIETDLTIENRRGFIAELETERVGAIADNHEFIALHLKLFLEFGVRREGERLIIKECML